jgi:hypothetical protein
MLVASRPCEPSNTDESASDSRDAGLIPKTLKGDKGTQRHTAQDFETIEGTKK